MKFKLNKIYIIFNLVEYPNYYIAPSLRMQLLQILNPLQTHLLLLMKGNTTTWNVSIIK